MHVGFDIGGTNARASLFDADWQQVGTVRQGVRDRSAPDEIAALVTSMLDDLLDEHEVGHIEGIGIGLAGQLSPNRRVVRNAPNLGWRDEPFADRVEGALADEFGSPTVVLVNDLNGLLWGEYSDGAIAEGIQDALVVYVGTGIGGAILADGELVVGVGGVAGEIGHSKVVSGGRLCGCGERGCVEAYAGGIHLERRVAEVAGEHEGLDEVFSDRKAGNVDLTAADQLADEREEIEEIWREATDYLAMVTANACTLLNPSVLLVGGGVVENCATFREWFLSKTTPLILEVARDPLEIRSPELGDDGGMLGAARLASQ